MEGREHDVAIPTLRHGIQVTNQWIKEVEAELESDDPQYAYRALRTYLHAIRDRVSVNEASQLAAQLPTLLRGIYYEGWKPSRTPVSYHHVSELAERMAAEGPFAGPTEAGTAMRAAASVVRNRISAGEIADIIAALPPELAEVVQGDGAG